MSLISYWECCWFVFRLRRRLAFLFFFIITKQQLDEILKKRRLIVFVSICSSFAFLRLNWFLRWFVSCHLFFSIWFHQNRRKQIKEQLVLIHVQIQQVRRRVNLTRHHVTLAHQVPFVVQQLFLRILQFYFSSFHRSFSLVSTKSFPIDLNIDFNKIERRKFIEKIDWREMKKFVDWSMKWFSLTHKSKKHFRIFSSFQIFIVWLTIENVYLIREDVEKKRREGVSSRKTKAVESSLQRKWIVWDWRILSNRVDGSFRFNKIDFVNEKFLFGRSITLLTSTIVREHLE